MHDHSVPQQKGFSGFESFGMVGEDGRADVVHGIVIDDVPGGRTIEVGGVVQKGDARRATANDP